MRVLMLHNFYRQPGGEDACFFAERDMLREHGDRVSTIELHNDAITGMSPAVLATKAVWNRSSYAAVARRIAEFRPDILHCHNIFPLLSPAVYYAASRAGVPVVQTLHNYRLLCLKAILFREGRICETCAGRAVPWPGIIRRCYHGSAAQSASVASLLVAHRVLGTWRRRVDLFLAVSAFTRDRHVAAGFDPAQIVVKPNVLGQEPPPEVGEANHALFVGRLSEEKGLRTALAAWRDAPPDCPPLLVVGDGPLRHLQKTCPPDGRVTFLGHRSREEIYSLMTKAAFLVAPSEWFETFGMTIIEAFACGTPVIAGRIGAYPELITDGVNGLLFEPGDAASLRAAVTRLMRSPSDLPAMRRAARRRFDEGYTRAGNYQALMAAYDLARRRRLGAAMTTT